MTGDTIADYLAERGRDITRADLAHLNLMLVDLPIEEVSDARAMVRGTVALIVADPLYDGDIEVEA